MKTFSVRKIISFACAMILTFSAVSVAENSNVSAEVTLSVKQGSTLSATVARPKAVNVSAVVSGKACRVKWTKAKNCTGYFVYMLKNGKYKLVRRASKNATSVRFTNLSGEKYYFRVVPIIRKNGVAYKSTNNKTLIVNMKTKKYRTKLNGVYSKVMSAAVKVTTKKNTNNK